jgi:hypothetical protein
MATDGPRRGLARLFLLTSTENRTTIEEAGEQPGVAHAAVDFGLDSGEAPLEFE